MPIRRYNTEAPIRSELVSLARVVTLRWLQWFQNVGEWISGVSLLDTPYDPPSVAPGGVQSAVVPFAGVRRRDVVSGVSFTPMTEGAAPVSGIQLVGTVNQDGAVLVTIFNVSGGAIDLDPGTLRIEVRAT
jgi:hypothetical protein